MSDQNVPLELPPPPRRPDPDECCGSGCMPCIMDLYEEALAEWGREVARRKAAAAKAAGVGENEPMP